MLGCEYEVLDNNYRKLMKKKRAEGKAWLRDRQHETAEKNPIMQIWLGKNNLDQTDKHIQELKVDKDTASLLGLIDGSTKGQLPNRQEDEDARE